MLKEHNKQNVILRTSVEIGVECMLIIVGFFVFKIAYYGKLETSEKRFCRHISPFLILTGITAIVSASKRLEKLQSGDKLINHI